MAFTLYIDGEPQESTYIEPGESFRVQLEDVERSSGYDEACINCGEPIEDRGNGAWFHTSTDHAVCNWTDESEDEDWDDSTDTVAEPGPFAWCNSAAITLDPDDNSVTVSISVGDPRGAFAFTVRQVPTVHDGQGIANPDLAGKLLIHTPYPGESLPHMDTIELRPGTLEVKGS